MSRLIGLARHEFAMSVRRPGFWIAYGLMALFFAFSILMPSANPAADIVSPDRIWPDAGDLVFRFNIFFPLLAGILAADRMWRDFQNGVRELQRSSPLPRTEYILGKYLGVLLSVLVPLFLLVAASGAWIVLRGQAPAAIFGPLLLAFLLIGVPAHAFVVAFSLACPLILPLRVYQVLFTGYWFWGNLLSPQAFPTISDTVLNAVGQYSLQAFFGVLTNSSPGLVAGFTPAQAALNLLVLAACIGAVFLVLNQYLRRRESGG
jgi:ABC-2 type transport system permease protein